MKDKIIDYYNLYMTHEDLSSTKEYPLPSTYSFRYFKPGDKKHWIDIEVSSGDIKDKKTGEMKFKEYYGDYIEELKQRCLFLLDEKQKPIGTATAFFDIKNPKIGHLHWVAIKEEYKGKSLSKPLVSRAMKLMYELGHTKAILGTQTTSWIACKVYLDLGWKPNTKDYPKSKQGWDIVIKKISNC